MSRYTIRRFMLAIPTLLAVSVLLFGLLHLAPGGPEAVYAAMPGATAEDIQRVKELLGLTDPVPVQYGKWLLGMVTGNWGTSYRYGQPAIELLGERVPNTLFLILTALVIAVVLAVPFGVISAVSKRKGVQYGASVFAMLGVSIPTFWLGMMLLLFFSVRLRWLPSGGMVTIGMGFDLWDRFIHVIGPASVLATLYLAGWSRYVRSSMLDVLNQDYIRTARAKGLRDRLVLYRHALRNALLPLVTLIGLQGGNLIGGAMITEVVFAWPGMGRLLAESLKQRDYPVLMAAFMMMAFLTILGNLLADLTYSWVDPRIRLE